MLYLQQKNGIHKTTVDFLAAFAENRARPTPEQMLTQNLLHARAMINRRESPSWNYEDGAASNVYCLADQQQAWTTYQDHKNSQNLKYIDTHCCVPRPLGRGTA
jgi:hypothetical protein